MIYRMNTLLKAWVITPKLLLPLYACSKSLNQKRKKISPLPLTIASGQRFMAVNADNASNLCLSLLLYIGCRIMPSKISKYT